MKALKKIRNMKVYEHLTQRGGFRIEYKSVPTIVLKGEWLRDLGFESGDRIQVQCDDGKLTITKTDEQIAGQDQDRTTAA